MNIKMAINSQLSTTKPKKKEKKKKLSKQPEQEQNCRYGDHLEGYQLGGGRKRMRGKIQEIKGIIGRYKMDQGMVMNSRGNGEAREVMCMTHALELRGGMLVGQGTGQRGQRKKASGNCNSIINKIYFLKRLPQSSLYL